MSRESSSEPRQPVEYSVWKQSSPTNGKPGFATTHIMFWHECKSDCTGAYLALTAENVLLQEFIAELALRVVLVG